MSYPLLTKLVARSPRIVDLVFLAEPAGRWRRLAAGGAVVLALYGGAFALVSHLGTSLGPWSAEMAARVHEAIAMERAVEVTPPPPPAPPPPAPAPEASHVSVSRSARAPREPPSRPTQPAQAGQIVAAAPAPADFTGMAFIVGSGSSYAGGATTSSGTNRNPALGPVAPEAPPRTAPAGVPSKARPVTLDQSAWNCPWPAEADAQQVNEQTVVLRAKVGADGRADRVAVLSDPGFGFGRRRSPVHATHALRARTRCGRSPHRRRVAAHPRPLLPVRGNMHRLRWIPLLLLVAAAGCKRHPASATECEAILQRLIELELSESGYHDPVLRARWQQDLLHRFASDLDRCRGLEVPNSLRACLAGAHHSEDIVHRCF
jgi:protein TonB